MFATWYVRILGACLRQEFSSRSLGRGDRYWFFVNGQYLSTFQDSTYLSGLVEPLSVSNGEDGAEAAFGQVAVWRA
jgi:hypothetical protein